MSEALLKSFGASVGQDGSWVLYDSTKIKPGPAGGSFKGQQVEILFDNFHLRLNDKRIAQIVMQKENWRRPDGRYVMPYEMYSGDAGFDLWQIGLGPLDESSQAMGVPRFRMFGFNRKQIGPHEGLHLNPVMHHKFLVGCSIDYIRRGRPERDLEDSIHLEPRSVWTGSMNMSTGSFRNAENAIILGPEPAKIYYQEWRDIFIHSEELTFYDCNDGPLPEWRVNS